MPVYFHIPECHDELCLTSLRAVRAAISRMEYTIASPAIHGTFWDNFQTNFERSKYTILIHCPELWSKIKNKKLLVPDKIICVKIRNQEGKKNNKTDQDKFFQNFQCYDISSDENISTFVRRIDEKYNLSGKSTQKYYNYLDSARDRHAYSKLEYSENVYDTSESDKTNEVYCTVSKEGSSSQEHQVYHKKDTFAKYLDNFGNRNGNVLVKGVLGPEEMETNLNLNSIGSYVTFDDLKTDLDKLLSSKEKHPLTVKYVLKQMLPTFYGQNSIRGIFTVSMCCSMSLQQQADDFMELLILKGQVLERPLDTTLLGEILEALTRSIIENSNKQGLVQDINISRRIKRQCRIFTMLQSKMAIACKGHDETKSFQNVNDNLNLLMKFECLQHHDSLDEYFHIIEQFLTTPLEEVQQTYRGCAIMKDDTFNVHEYVSNLLKKPEPHYHVVILHCLNKLFRHKNTKKGDFELLEEFVKVVQKNTKKANASKCLCIRIILRSLVHYLGFLYRELPHKDIIESCSEVYRIIGMIYKKEIFISEEDLLFILSLMFDATPVIRRKAIELFKSWRIYEKEIAVFTVSHIHQLLCPVVYISEEEKRQMLELYSGPGWYYVTGQFKGAPVIIHFYIQSEHEHKHFDKSKPPNPNNALYLNQIDKLKNLDHPGIVILKAWQIDSLPQFYIVEDYKTINLLDNTNLQNYLVCRSINRQFCGPATLMSFLIQVCQALEYCHQNGIIHRNITAASVFMLDNNNVKLGGFYLALDEKAPDCLLRDIKRWIPVRWSAPESHKRCKFSKESDVWMFGHLIYETLSHGALPYSDLKIDDMNCVAEICNYTRLHRELCFTDEEYDLILECTAFDPSDRPSLSSVVKKLEKIQEELRGSQINVNRVFPDLDGEDRQASTNYNQIPVYQEIDMPYVRPLPLKFLKKMSSRTNLYRVGRTFTIRQLVKRKFTPEFQEQRKLGALDSVVHSMIIRDLLPESSLIDVHISNSLHGNLLEIVLSKSPMGAIHKDNMLLVKIAEMLQKIHERNFILGDLRASQVFVEAIPHANFKVRPVCWGYSNYIGTASTVKMEAKPVYIERVAPEWRDRGIQSKASDIYSFGQMVCELFEALNCEKIMDKIDVFDKDRSLETLADIMESGFNPTHLTQPLLMSNELYALIKRCIDFDSLKRPSIEEIISELTEQSLYVCNQSVMSQGVSWLLEASYNASESSGDVDGRDFLSQTYSTIDVVTRTGAVVDEETNWILRAVNPDDQDSVDSVSDDEPSTELKTVALENDLVLEGILKDDNTAYALRNGRWFSMSTLLFNDTFLKAQSEILY